VLTYLRFVWWGWCMLEVHHSYRSRLVLYVITAVSSELAGCLSGFVLLATKTRVRISPVRATSSSRQLHAGQKLFFPQVDRAAGVRFGCAATRHLNIEYNKGVAQQLLAQTPAPMTGRCDPHTRNGDPPQVYAALNRLQQLSAVVVVRGQASARPQPGREAQMAWRCRL
jgi:hypothetical protein